MRPQPERSVRVFARESPLDLFTGLSDTDDWLSQMQRDWKLQSRRGFYECEDYEQVKAMQRALDGAHSRQDGEKTGEWVICMPIFGHPFAQPVAVVRKYCNNGNTYLATPYLDLGFFMAFELIPLGATSYDRF